MHGFVIEERRGQRPGRRVGEWRQGRAGRAGPFGLAAILALGCGLAIAACSDGGGTPARPPEELGIDLTDQERCDPLVAGRCLLPFPNDYYTVEAPTPTGRRVQLSPLSLPANAGGVHVDPTEQNRADGFSPGSPLLISMPGVDLVASGAPRLDDLARSLEADSPVVVVDLASGERWPAWAEFDSYAPSPSEATLIVRPARNFLEGHRYGLALRNLVDGNGDPLPASAAFAAYRDGLRTTDERFESRRERMEDLFAALDDAGVTRASLQLAFDFTIASAHSLAGRLLHVRDDAFARLGEASPRFTVESATDTPGPRVFRRIDGTYSVPSYLTGDGGPGTGFALGDDGKPIFQESEITVPFRCVIPPASADDPTTPPAVPLRTALYGHGLLGDLGELGSDLVLGMAIRHQIAYCATNWIGLAEEDVGNAIAVLQDLSRFSTIADRSQQGFLDFLFLGRLVKHVDGFTAHPAFRVNGRPLLDRDQLYFDGNSQGAIYGGALMAVAQDFTRGVLGEAGMNYSLLLQRSVDFDDYKLVFDPSYPDPYDQLVGISLIQMLWDRAETSGYAQHLTDDPLPGTPPHQILLLGAVGDHQVSEYALQIEARSIGARGHVPYVHPSRLQGMDKGFGIEPIPSYPWRGSAYFLFDTGSPLSPLTNTPPREGHDPHDDTPNIPIAQDLKNEFLRPDGVVIDVCQGGPCVGEPHGD